MKMLKKVVLCLSILVTMSMAFVIGCVGKHSHSDNIVNSNATQNVNRIEKPTHYTFDMENVSIQKGGDTLNYSYVPSINARNSSGVVAYEYGFGNIMEKAAAVNIKSIDTTDVNVSYAYSSTKLDTSSGNIKADTSFTLQQMPNRGDKIYIYIFVSPINLQIPSTFSSSIVWWFGVPKQMPIINNLTNEIEYQTVVSGQKIDKNTLKQPADFTRTETVFNSGSIWEEDTAEQEVTYYFDAWFLDKDYTQMIDEDEVKPGQQVYARFANLTENYLGWNGESYYVKNVSGTSTYLPVNLVIPSIYNDKTNGTALITEIETGYDEDVESFSPALHSVSHIELPFGLTTIESEAFSYCDITSIDLSRCTNLTSIGNSAFYYCENLISINLSNCTSLTIIEKSVFNSCSSLTSITLPSSLTSIGDIAFNGCNGLTNIVIPSSVTSIGYSAFQNCRNLTSIDLSGCTNLTTIENQTFWYCNGLTSIDLSGCINLTSIGIGVFENCSGLTSVALPSSVTSIGDRAFHNCTNLTSVNLSNCTNLTSIGNYALSCIGLTSITLPSSLTSIGQYAFKNCTSLTSIDLSGCINLTSIGDGAFSESESLISIDLSHCTNLTIIEYSMFFGCYGLRTVSLPSNITTIEAEAFCGCESLTSIDLSHCTNLTRIENVAFGFCINLTSITLPSSLTSISGEAFSDCYALTSIVIPANVTKIGRYAFSYCDNLTSLTFEASGTWYYGTQKQQEAMDGGTPFEIVAGTNYATEFKETTYNNYYVYKK